MEPLQENKSGQNELNITENTLKEDETSKIHPQHWCGQYSAASDSSTSVYNYSDQENKEKSAMCRVAEIAKYNKIRHVYDLMDESGPAHKKLFTVKLVLTQTEVFEGSGSSIKRAQQAAAENAIEKTTLPLPPEKNTRRRKGEVQLPQRILHNVCRTLNFAEPVFQTIPVPPEGMLPPQSPYQWYQPYSPIDPTASSSTNNNRPKHYHASIVKIGSKQVATGFGPSITLAKMDAASKALTILNPTLQEHSERVINSKQDCEGKQVDENDVPRYKRKSVISDVHEKAHQMRTKVVFEVICEEGPPHDRQYVVRCAFVDNENKIIAEAQGKGRKKKEAQQEACSILLQSLRDLAPENDPLTVVTTLWKNQKKLSQNSKDVRRKTIVKDKKMDPDYGHQINPVSRLIQVVQTKHNEHPVFELVGEHGHSRYKQFIIRVTCVNESCDGKGPNKKLAKRSAAEAMLAALGYIKPLPAPGKSLLKKRCDKDKGDLLISPKSSDVSETNSAKSPDFSEELHEGNEIRNDSSDRMTSPQSEKKHVTFNSQVQACPPPGDQNYPNTITIPLKIDVIIEGKIRKLRRTKENRRSLTPEEKVELAKMAASSLDLIQKQPKFVVDGKEVNAKTQLDMISTMYKFSVSYSELPQQDQHFSLVSLGFEEPSVHPGIGFTVEEAAEDAALNALKNLNLWENQEE
ncbi:unnamed protein product [Caenorhabditis angaria]|uniref:DRBM domain-containing protein n=1 Tax=Caenorhabditis angaria TaxID=860376 RepID=A0A9P1NCV2_9PELO|nr:unnamed protein product [Caenorhabditis angaria]